MIAPQNPPGLVVRTEAHKAAGDNGFRIEQRNESSHRLAASGETAPTSLRPLSRRHSESVGALFIPVSNRGALHRPRRLRGIELAVAQFDAASPLMPGNDDTDMVRAGPLACSGDFLLRLAVCQGDLIAEGRRAALVNCHEPASPSNAPP
jgi:hypothetical protein